MQKPLNRSDKLDMDKIVEQSGGNRFMLVVMASARAREIRQANRLSGKFEHVHSVVTALMDFQEGKYNEEYIKRVK